MARRLAAAHCEGAGEGGNRRVTRTERNGVVTVLTDRYKGKRYNAPNDLSMDSTIGNHIFRRTSAASPAAIKSSSTMVVYSP